MASIPSQSSSYPNHPISTDVPSLESVLDLLKIPQEAVLCAYPYGSHLFGLARPDSDWDMIVVVNDFVGPLVKTATHPGATLPGFEEGVVLSQTLDVTVYHEQYWKYLLRENVIRILLCMGIPKSMVLVEREPIKFALNYQRMKTNLYNYVKARERISRKLWASGQVWNSKKQLLHVLRATEVAHQLVKTGDIVDYTSANHFWPECAALNFDTWDAFKKWFDSHYIPLYEPLKEQLNVYKTVFAELSNKTNALPILDYLQFQALDNFAILDRDMSIRTTVVDYPLTRGATAVDSKSNPILIERGWDSPRHDAIHQCYRIVVERDQDASSAHWRVLASAPKKYWDWGADRYVTEPSERFVGKLDFSTTKAYKKPQGIGVLMLWHQNQFVAIFASSGLYTAQFAARHGVELSQLGHVLHDPFWESFERKGYLKPDSKYSKWTFEFTYHPDEDLLQLDAIMDHKDFLDISLAPACDHMENETSNDPLFEIFAKRMNWASLEYVPLTFPSKLAKTENAVLKNMEMVQKKAGGATDLPLLRYEGFLLVDAHGTRVQVSLPQYHSITMLYSPFERKYRTRHFLAIVRATLNLGDISSPDNSGEARFCRYFPQWASWYRYIAAVLRRMCDQIDKSYATVSHLQDQADFRVASEAISFAHAKIFWKMRINKCTTLAYLTNPLNLNEGPATQFLTSWVDQFKIFDDVHLEHEP
jgi:predicted nucleotidyltransferase